MEHVVFWSSQSGPAFERVSALAAAIDLVQRLRNEEGVTDAEVHELTAVPLSFRTVVVVEPVAAEPVGMGSGPFAAGSQHSAAPTLSAFSNPGVDDGAAVAPLGATVPGVVPDPVGPFKSLAAVEAIAVEAGMLEDLEPPAPHLVGLPAVAADEAPDGADEPSESPLLHAVAEVPDQATGYELPVEAPVRSLGLFA